MKIGICGDTVKWKKIAEAGFDYAEANFSKVVSASDEDFDHYLEERRSAGIEIEAYNGFFGSGFCLYGDIREDGSVALRLDSKLDEIREYAEKGFSRASKLGGKIAVFGSSKARDLRAGITKEEAEEHVVRVLRICGDVAQKYGMRVALEPLRRQEANFINTVSEGLELCKRAAHPSVGLLVDLFHFYMNGEDIEDIKKAKDYIIHVHMARPDPDRKYPTEADIEPCRVWAETLHSIGYDGRVSLECSFKDEFDIGLTKVKCVTDMFKYRG